MRGFFFTAFLISILNVVSVTGDTQSGPPVETAELGLFAKLKAKEQQQKRDKELRRAEAAQAKAAVPKNLKPAKPSKKDLKELPRITFDEPETDSDPNTAPAASDWVMMVARAVRKSAAFRGHEETPPNVQELMDIGRSIVEHANEIADQLATQPLGSAPPGQDSFYKAWLNTDEGFGSF